MRMWKASFSLLLASFLSASLYAQDPVPSLQDLVGARGAAVDELSQRGYSFVRTEKSGDSSYTYWTENRSGRCVIARVEQGRVASIVEAPRSDCGSGGGAAIPEDKFETVCGVITGGQTYRYRCQVVETMSDEGHRLTILRFPDIEMRLHFHRTNHVGVEIEGSETVQTTYSTSEGETDFILDGKSYFFISDKRAARWELENFRD